MVRSSASLMLISVVDSLGISLASPRCIGLPVGASEHQCPVVAADSIGQCNT